MVPLKRLPASVLGDIASSELGSLGIYWESSPALTEVEEVVCDWMRQLSGLSTAWHGTIHDTASTACVTAMILARERASELSKNTAGLQGFAAPLVIYSTAQAHSSVAKAAQLAGFGNDNLQTVCVRHIPRDAEDNKLAGEALDKHTQAWLGEINSSGAAFLSPSQLDDVWIVRVSIGVENTTLEHVERLWTLMQESV